MAQVLELDLRCGDYIFAWLEKFTIFSGWRTLSGVEFTFEFEIQGSDKATECNLSLQKVEIDVSVFVGSDSFM